jgi:hypothetical protein
MIKFIKSPIEYFEVEGVTYRNPLINIDAVGVIEKSKGFSDRGLKAKMWEIPTIDFHMKGYYGMFVWYFENVAQRDKEFNSLLKQFSL